MVRIGPLSIGAVGIATLAIVTPLVLGFFKAGGAEAAQRGGAALAKLVADPVGGTLGALFEASKQLGAETGKDIQSTTEDFRDRIEEFLEQPLRATVDQPKAVSTPVGSNIQDIIDRFFPSSGIPKFSAERQAIEALAAERPINTGATSFLE